MSDEIMSSYSIAHAIVSISRQYSGEVWRFKIGKLGGEDV